MTEAEADAPTGPNEQPKVLAYRGILAHPNL
jgi:hypothetical protein